MMLQETLSTLTDVINELATAKCMCENGLAFYDKLYNDKYGFSEEQLYAIVQLEHEAILLERDLWAAVKASPNATVSKVVNDYFKQHSEFIANYLYVLGSAQHVVEEATQLEQFFQKLPTDGAACKDIGEQRLNKLRAIAALDGFGEPLSNPGSPSNNYERLVIRWRRIFLRKRLLTYSYAYSQCIRLSKYEYNGKSGMEQWVYTSNSIDVNGLTTWLVNQLDYDFNGLIACFKQPLKAATAAPLDEIKELEDLLAAKDNSFREAFLTNDYDKVDSKKYEEYTKERDALRYLLDEKKKNLGYKDRFVYNAQQQSLKNISKDFGKYMASEVGSAVASALWKTVQGKGGDADWGKVAQNVAVAAAKGAILSLSKAFLGGMISAGFVEGVFGKFFPAPPDPVLQKLGIIDEKLDQVLKAVAAIDSHIAEMAQKVESLIKDLPEAVKAKMQEGKIHERIGDLRTHIHDAWGICANKISGDNNTDVASVEQLMGFEKKFIEGYMGIVKLLYDEAIHIESLAPYETLIMAEKASTNSYARFLIDNAQKESYRLDFFRTMNCLYTLYDTLCNELTSYFNQVQPFVHKTLHIYYVCGVYGSNKRDERMALYNKLRKNVQYQSNLGAMLHQASFLLRQGMMGVNNCGLFLSMAAYGTGDAAKQLHSHHSLHGFGLRNGKGEFLRYDGGLKNAGSTQPPPRFYINPGFLGNAEKNYTVATIKDRDSLEHCFFEAGFWLLDNDTIKLQQKGGAMMDVQVVALFDDAMNGGDNHFFDHLAAANKQVELVIGKTLTVHFWRQGHVLQCSGELVSGNQYKWRLSLCNQYTNKSVTLANRTLSPDETLNRQAYLAFDAYSIGVDIRLNGEGNEMKWLWKITNGKPTNDVPALGLFDYEVTQASGNLLLDNRLLLTHLPAQNGPDKLPAGRKLCKNQSLASRPRGVYQLWVDNDAKVANKAKETEIWALKDDAGKPINGELLLLQPNGILTVYDRQGKRVWNSYKEWQDWVWNKATQKLELQAKNNLCGQEKLPYLKLEENRQVNVYGGDDVLLNELKIVQPRYSLLPNESLAQGEYIELGASPFPIPPCKLVFQTDGNFVASSGSKVVWATGTHNKGGQRVVMEPNGRLVVYGSNNTVLWQFETHVQGAFLSIDGDMHVTFINLKKPDGNTIKTLASFGF